MTEQTEFAGFPLPEKNFFSLPNEFINIIARITNLSELKIIIYVIRHTWGYREFGICKTISVDEFMHGRRCRDSSRMDEGTGLSKQGVLDGIERAIKDGYLLCEVDASDLGRTKKSYALKMIGGVNDLDGVHKSEGVKHLDPSTGQQSRQEGSTNQTPEVSGLDPRGQEFRPRSEKETLGNTSRKTSKKERNDTPTSSQPDVSHSSFSSQNIHQSISSSSGGVVHPSTRSGEKDYVSDENDSHIATNQEMSGNASVLEQITDISESVETPHRDAPDGQGYKTENSSTTEVLNISPQVVVEKSTAEVKPRVGKKTTSQQMTLIEAALVEPDMTGPWTAEKVVQYAEFHNQKRYPDKQRAVQIEAARTLHREDANLTLEQFKLAYDECLRDGWWKGNVGDLHVKHMQMKIKNSGVTRLYAMLRKAEQHQKKVIQFKPRAGALQQEEQPSTSNQKALEKQRKMLEEKRAKDAQKKGNQINGTPTNNSRVIADAKEVCSVGM